MNREYEYCIFPKCYNYVQENDTGLCARHFYWLVQNCLSLNGPMCVEKDCPNLKTDCQELCKKHISIYNMRSFVDKTFKTTREITKLRIRDLLEKELIISIKGITISLLESIRDCVSDLLITKCECCFEKFTRDQLIICSNYHGFCVNCVQRYVESMIHTSSVSLKCMICDGCLYTDDLRMCIQVDTYLKFCIAMDIKEVAELARIVDNYQICPFCASYGCIVDIIIIHPTCQKCNLIWCSGCRRKTHLGDCFTILDSDDVEDVDKMIQEIITNSLTHKCPKCKTKHYREDGCNHILCPVCSTHSCYICGEEISGIFVYAHYEIAGSKCKLYGNDNNIPNFLKELGKFIDNNHENRVLIYERLKINCKSDKVLFSRIKSLKALHNISNTSDPICCIT